MEDFPMEKFLETNQSLLRAIKSQDAKDSLMEQYFSKLPNNQIVDAILFRKLIDDQNLVVDIGSMGIKNKQTVKIAGQAIDNLTWSKLET